MLGLAVGVHDRATHRMASTESDLFQIRKDERNGERLRLEQSLLHILGVLQERHLKCLLLDDGECHSPLPLTQGLLPFSTLL